MLFSSFPLASLCQCRRSLMQSACSNKIISSQIVKIKKEYPYTSISDKFLSYKKKILFLFFQKHFYINKKQKYLKYRFFNLRQNQYSLMKVNSKLINRTQVSLDAEPEQPKKDRNFYKPEEFIWNNPYRSSSRLYRYYHASNDQFQEQTAPKIKQLEKEDKENAQKERIVRVLQNRSKSRELLKQRQLSRELLEKKTFGSQNNHSRFSQSLTNLNTRISQQDKCIFSSTNSPKTLKSLETIKQFTSTANELPPISAQNSEASIMNSRKSTIKTLKKVGSRVQLRVTFNLKKRKGSKV